MSPNLKDIKGSHGGFFHLNVWVVWCIIHVVTARGTLESFKADYCEKSSESVTLYKLSYIDCVDECKARDKCTGANYRSILDTCLLNLGTSSPDASGCKGVQYSRKADWITKKLLPSCNCGAGKKCTINSNGDPVCVVAECSPVAAVTGAVILGNRNDVGMKMTYKCDATLTAVGQPTRTCLDSGHWSGSPVTCAAAASLTATSTSTSTTTSTSTSTTTSTSTSTSTSSSTSTSTSTTSTTTTTPPSAIPCPTGECQSPLVCRSGTCQCPIDRIYYDAISGTCHADCSVYGDTFQTFSNTETIMKGPKEITYYTSIPNDDSCKTKCLEHSTSTCTHADRNSNLKCILFKGAFQSTEIKNSTGVSLFVRDCITI